MDGIAGRQGQSLARGGNGVRQRGFVALVVAVIGEGDRLCQLLFPGQPAIPPQIAPASVPSTIASRMWRNPGSPSNDEPTQTPT